MTLASRFAGVTVRPDTIACVWLGQAGYLFKTAAGLTVMIDPYLSDECEERHGLKRFVPAPIRAHEFEPDVLLVSHGHLDHLDEPTVRTYASNAHTVLVGPASCTARAMDWGWSHALLRSLKAGESTNEDGCQVMATFARHTVDDAIGFLLTIDGIRLWHSGDTEYDEHLRGMTTHRIDVAFICINGGGGNMNAYEAALLAWQVKPRLVVPMHYGMWSAEDYTYGGEAPDATPDPTLFATTLAKLDSHARQRELHVGRPVQFACQNSPGQGAPKRMI